MKTIASILILPLFISACTVRESRQDYGDYSGAYATPGPDYGPQYTTDPNYAPAYGQPGYGQPAYGQPGYVQPGYNNLPPGSYVQNPPGPGYVQPRAVPALNPRNLEMLRAGDSLVGSIDQYVVSIQEAQRPEAIQLKQSLAGLRAVADNFRNTARAGNQPASLQPAAADILNRFNTANQLYARCVSLDRRFNSALFGKVADATARVQQSVR